MLRHAMHMRIRHMSALTTLTSDKNPWTRCADEGRILALSIVRRGMEFEVAGLRHVDSKTHSLLSCLGGRLEGDSTSRWPQAFRSSAGQAAPSSASHASSAPHWLKLDGMGASRCLTRLAPAYIYAHSLLSLLSPTTHLPQRPCPVLQASNSFQQLGVVQTISPRIRAPAVWAALRFPAHRGTVMDPSSSSPSRGKLFCTSRCKRDTRATSTFQP